MEREREQTTVRLFFRVLAVLILLVVLFGCVMSLVGVIQIFKIKPAR